MCSIEYKSQVISYRIIRSSRKSIGISILSTKEVIVRAPRFVSNQELERLVRTKGDWILAKQKEMGSYEDKQQKESYKVGDTVLYRGKEYTIRIEQQIDIKKASVRVSQDEILITKGIGKGQEIKEVLLAWYKEKVKERVKQRILYYSRLINEPIGDIRIKSQKTRWGSCSSKGNLNFNWKIILMPDEMFDYIIVHEMCHLKFLNHSKEYWNSVASILPDYKEREKWIKSNSYQIMVGFDL